MTDGAGAWSHRQELESNGLVKLQIVDEDGVAFPVARQLSPGQAEKLVQTVSEESVQSGRAVKAVIRDAPFMAATVLTVKRQPI